MREEGLENWHWKGILVERASNNIFNLPDIWMLEQGLAGIVKRQSLLRATRIGSYGESWLLTFWRNSACRKRYYLKERVAYSFKSISLTSCIQDAQTLFEKDGKKRHKRLKGLHFNFKIDKASTLVVFRTIVFILIDVEIIIDKVSTKYPQVIVRCELIWLIWDICWVFWWNWWQ